MEAEVYGYRTVVDIRQGRHSHRRYVTPKNVFSIRDLYAS